MDIKHTYIPRWGSRLWLALAATALTGCINEDLSDCGADVALTYDISLQIDLHNELQADLTSAAEQQLAARIEETLGGVFTTQARTVDLSFFDAATLEPYRHDAYTVNAGEATFTLYVQPGSYDHAALASTADLGNLRYTAASRFGTLSVTQEQADTVESQTTGIFTATARLDVNAGQSQHFRVPLHMRNSAAVLVLQPTGTVRPTALTAYVRDMATMFTPADSTFSGFDRSPVVRTVRTDEAGLTAFHAVCFPSADTKTDRRTTGDVSISGDGLWRMEVYATMPDGRITLNTLHMQTALPAGGVKVIKANINDQGQVTTADHSVGVSVELDWKPGGNHDVEM